MSNFHKYKSFKEWAINTHSATNHFYDGDADDITALPYSYHLKLVVDVLYKFKPFLLSILHLVGVSFEVLEAACWGHDLIEDARASYNDIVKAAMFYGFTKEEAIQIAEIIRAVTNYSRGRDRDERMPDWLYKEIRETPGATIVKLCDRGGNLKHGVIKGSNQKGMYKSENPHFKEMLYDKLLQPLFDYIEKLLNTEL